MKFKCVLTKLFLTFVKNKKSRCYRCLYNKYKYQPHKFLKNCKIMVDLIFLKILQLQNEA